MKTKLDTFKRLQEKIIQGDKKAMVRFVEITYPNMFQTAFSIIRNVHDAEDICQESFLHFFSSLPKFEGKSSLQTWLYRITVNCAIDILRARKTKITELNEDFINGKDEPSKTIENKELSLKVHDAIEKLGAQQRAVFTLKHFNGLKFEEISQIMGISPSTAKTHFYRAIGGLRESLREYVKEQQT